MEKFIKFTILFGMGYFFADMAEVTTNPGVMYFISMLIFVLGIVSLIVSTDDGKSDK